MFNNRIIASSVSIFAVGVVFGIIIGTDDAVWYCSCLLFASAVLAVGAYCSHRRGRDKIMQVTRAAAIAVALCFLGILLVWLCDERREVFCAFDGMEDSVTAEVTDINSYYGTDAFTAKIKSSERGIKTNTSVRIEGSCIPKGISIGDKINCSVVYGEAAKSYLLSEDIKLTATATQCTFSKGSGLLYTVRNFVSDGCERFFDTEGYSSAMAKAVTVGDTTGLDSYFYKLFNNAGISHILSISGMHVSLLVMCLFNFLLIFRIPYRIRSVVATFFAVLYMALLGFTPSVVRATVMAISAIISRGITKRTDSITMMFIALFLLMVQNPYCLLSKGLQLSFLCCSALMLSTTVTKKILFLFVDRESKGSVFYIITTKIATAIIIPAVSSFAAVFFTVPILFTSYDTFSYIAPLTNIVAVPIFNLGLVFVFLTVLVGSVFPPLGELLSFVPEFVFDFITRMCQWIFRRDIGSISTHIDHMWVPFVISLFFVFVLVCVQKRRIFWICLASVCFVASVAGCSVISKLSFDCKTVAEVGTGSSCYAYYSAKGYNSYFDLGGRYSQPLCVFENGEVSVDEYVLTELTEDSKQRAATFFGRANVLTVVLPYPQNDEETVIFDEIILLANQIKCDIMLYDKEYVSDRSGIERALFLHGASGQDEVSVYFEGDGNSIAVLSKGYHRSDACDIAIVTDGYSGTPSNIDCDLFCANDIALFTKTLTDTRCFSFKNRVRIEYKHDIGDRIVYEP